MMKNSINILLLFIALGACTNSNTPVLRVATYNIRQDTPHDSLNAWSYRKEAVKALIQYHDFDIVGTQEGFLHQIQDLSQIPGYTYFGVGRDDGEEKGEHSAIVYKKEKFKLLDSGNYWLSETPDIPSVGWDATRYKRICSWVKFEHRSTGMPFYVFCVHFDHQGVVAQLESAKLMVKKIKDIAGEMPVICMGDFNSKPEAAPVKIMSDFLINAMDISEAPPYGPKETSNTKFSIPINKCIDYVFVSSHFSVQKYAVLTDLRTAYYFPSDHQPVVADVKIK
jgi:endonuclease/exonuclease/phosphatase family metal-dependent hydrolase